MNCSLLLPARATTQKGSFKWIHSLVKALVNDTSLPPVIRSLAYSCFFCVLYLTFSSAALGWSCSMSLFMPASATPRHTGLHSNPEEWFSFFLFFFLFLYKKRSNSIWDFRCLVTRWLLSSLIGGFGDGSFFRSSHKLQLDHTWRRLHFNVYDGEDLLSEAFKSVPGWGSRECRIVGNGGNSGPGQPCRTHVWVSRHRARSVCPD